MEIKNVVVVGTGTMGAGIGQLCAQQGFNTTLVDISEEVAEQARVRIDKGLSRRVERGKISSEEKDQVLARITTSGDYAVAERAQFVVESVTEDLDVKRKVFAELDRLAPLDTILASNTTSLSISAIAGATNRPDKVVQMHFFNPPFIMKLVEIMPGAVTSQETIDATLEFARLLGKDPVVCKNEAPGGIVSRILGAMLNEATWLYAAGIADAGDIDKAMKLGAGHPMGPMEILDLIGLDVHRAKMQTFFQALGEARYKHPGLIDEMIGNGKLGRKSGQGFHDYRSAR